MEALNTYKTEKTLAEQMNERLAEMKMTKAEAALKMNYSRAALSQYLNGKYASDPTELEKKVREFLAATGGVAEGQEPENSVPTGAGTLKKKVEFFESRDFVQTIGVCQACQEYMGLGIIVGKSGQGKTHALKKYAELPRVAYIECDDTMACRDLVEAIENGIGLPKGYGGTIWGRVNRIREFFNTNEGFLLIIDEADKLINKYTQKKMEILRGIFDQSNVGIVIAGEPRLETAGLIISPDISKYLDYLQGAGYIEFTEEKVTAYNAYANDAVIKLTKEGVDLAEGTIEDNGVDI